MNRPRNRLAKSNMPMPSCQTILIRSPGASKDVKIAGMRVAPQNLLDLRSASPFMPCACRAGAAPQPHSHPEGTGIIAATARRHPLQHRGVNVAVDANPSPALQVDLDQLRVLAPPATGRVIDRGRLAFGTDAGNGGISLVISTATN